MNENLNLVEILKDVPEGTELWSPLCGVVILKNILRNNGYSIRTATVEYGDLSFTAEGKFFTDNADGECLLFPSKDQRDWSLFKVAKNKQNNAQTFKYLDPKIGEVFEFEGMKLKAVPGHYSCDDCALSGFDKECSYISRHPKCTMLSRRDHEDVIFKIVTDDTATKSADQPLESGEIEKYIGRGRYLGTFGDGYGAFNYVSAEEGDYIIVCTVLKDIKFLHKYVYTNGSWLHAGMICGPTIETFGHSIPAELYERLDYLGILPNEVREHNVGTSDYAQHTIQPWSIWLDYPELTSWDHDILKRILRTKQGEARELDYEKIIQICQERLRQLKHQQQ